MSLTTITDEGRAMSDDTFTELVQVLAFSTEAAAVLGAEPIPPHIALYADQEAQVRGYATWQEAAASD